MKLNRYYSLLFTVIIIFIIILFLFRDKDYSLEHFNLWEEATPVRLDDEIIGLDYVITIGKHMKQDSILMEPKIFESINHYLDIQMLDSFQIFLVLDNNSRYPYLLKNIHIVDSNSQFIENVRYQKSGTNQFYFQLPRNFLENYHSNYKIQLELEK